MVSQKDILKLPAGLIARLAGAGPIAVALSGGVDSRFLCHAARLRGIDVLAAHVAGPHIPAAETAYARAWAEKARIPLLEAWFDPLQLPEAAHNGKNRCHACKTGMFAAMRNALDGHGQGHRRLCDGANASDQHAYRPGQRAAAEAGVFSPLAILTKGEIRALAAETGMEWPEQAARPCLLTRFAYGMPISLEALRKAAECEARLQGLLEGENIGFRLRFRPEPVLHLERMPAAGPAPLEAALAASGLAGCPLEIRNPLSGYFDATKA